MGLTLHFLFLQVPDFKALVGDSSDNLPGIPGIGPKTAAQLLQRCGTVEGVFEAEAMMQHKDAVRNKLAGQQEAALMYKHLTVIRCGALSMNQLCWYAGVGGL